MGPLVSRFHPAQYANRKYLEFRHSGGVIIPYVALSPPDGGKLPIQSLCIGPQSGLTEELSATLGHDFLAKYGYGAAPVLGSGIPLRSRKR